MSVQQDIARIIANVEQHDARVGQAVRSAHDDYCENTMVSYMKANAPWEDRPDDQRPKGLPHARELLAYVPDHPADLSEGGRGYLIQGATYGWALELAHGSRFGILPPTVATLGQGLIQRIQDELT